MVLTYCMAVLLPKPSRVIMSPRRELLRSILIKTKSGFLIQSDCTIKNFKDVLVNEHQFVLSLRITMADDVTLTLNKSLKATGEILGRLLWPLR